MLNYIWAFMIIVGVFFSGIQGGRVVEAVSNGALDSAEEAISLCIVMLGVVGLWSGIMNIAKEAGLIEKWTKALSPVLTFLFPDIPKEHPARGYIATNMIANILGLGWAATPAGLKAMEELKILGGNKSVATKEMCTLLVLNISSLQLIPVNIIAYRSQYSSQSPTSIIGPALVTTSVSTIVAVIFCKLMCNNEKGKKHLK
ncbi:MAG: nucleoside recognition protein [Lachnospiraceae bacterium]|nr:nucleoside recognition protein [Lachnospiraceae bacterium]